MTDFRKLSDTMLVSPQITPEDLQEAKTRGVTMIINNRPDGETPDQTDGATIETAARALGIHYVEVPVGQSGMSEQQVVAMGEAVAQTDGTVLAYCRSGTRSTLLWSLAMARQGMAPDAIAQAASDAGYDVGPIRPTMDMFAAQADARNRSN